ncbi:hypothetical protein C4566_03005 [Candidatus Parcubacteria bacterium]|nr:MAG: hypothetical protein C4566_03005 [Candidatus Parcubacteria bacterium]
MDAPGIALSHEDLVSHLRDDSGHALCRCLGLVLGWPPETGVLEALGGLGPVVAEGWDDHRFADKTGVLVDEGFVALVGHDDRQADDTPEEGLVDEDVLVVEPSVRSSELDHLLADLPQVVEPGEFELHLLLALEGDANISPGQDLAPGATLLADEERFVADVLDSVSGGDLAGAGQALAGMAHVFGGATAPQNEPYGQQDRKQRNQAESLHFCSSGWFCGVFASGKDLFY